MNHQLSLFDNDNIIYSYTRAQALSNGVLIDVTVTAKELGLRFPTVVTAALWDQFIVPVESSNLSCQSIEGRLWDTLWLYRCAAKNTSSDILFFEVSYVMQGRKISPVKLKAVCGPGDQGEPVITIMIRDED